MDMKLLKLSVLMLVTLLLASCAGPEKQAADISFSESRVSSASRKEIMQEKQTTGTKATERKEEKAAVSSIPQQSLSECEAVSTGQATVAGTARPNPSSVQEPKTEWKDAEPEPERKEPEPEQKSQAEEKADTSSQHKHEFLSKITRKATCSEPGIRTWYCSCGISYPENIPATGEHKWTDICETLHHDAVTETIWVTDRAAWNETIKINAPVYEERLVVVATCRGCGARFSCGTQYETIQECHRHIVADHANSCGYGTEDSYYEQVQTGWQEATDTVFHPEEGHYEERTVKEAYDEKIVTGRRCISCGYTE